MRFGVGEVVERLGWRGVEEGLTVCKSGCTDVE